MDFTQQNQDALLQELNQFTRRTHTLDEVYLLDVLLCDNEVDRDFERFSDSALETLKTLFVGKTGIFDHDPSGKNQTARIFSTRLETHPEQLTSTGVPYTCLKANAYMVRTAGNADFIREIDAGIKKEVSISCSARSHTCSICGKDRRLTGCPHVQGELYQGMLCHTILSDITDAYEWSFVAVPAQRNAGVTKQYGGRPRPDHRSSEAATEPAGSAFCCGRRYSQRVGNALLSQRTAIAEKLVTGSRTDDISRTAGFAAAAAE
mgnify:CR=1 FL=1